MFIFLLLTILKSVSKRCPSMVLPQSTRIFRGFPLIPKPVRFLRVECVIRNERCTAEKKRGPIRQTSEWGKNRESVREKEAGGKMSLSQQVTQYWIRREEQKCLKFPSSYFFRVVCHLYISLCCDRRPADKPITHTQVQGDAQIVDSS